MTETAPSALKNINADISAEIAELDTLTDEIHALQAKRKTSSDAEKSKIDKVIKRKNWAKHDIKVKKIAPKLGLDENTSATPVSDIINEWRIIHNMPEPTEIPAELSLTERISLLENQNKILEERLANLEERFAKLKYDIFGVKK